MTVGFFDDAKNWFDPTNNNGLKQYVDPFGGQIGALGSQIFGIGANDPTNPERSGLRNVGGGAQGFATLAGNNYGADTAGMQGTIGMLQGLASGQNSVSAEQLRQGLQQSQAQQMSMAASAAPQNQAMAARNAMMNSGQLASGMMGQQAMAGLQERQNALNALAQLQAQMRGQDVTGALGGYNAAAGAYGAGIQKPQNLAGSIVGGGIGGLMGGMMAGGGK